MFHLLQAFNPDDFTTVIENGISWGATAGFGFMGFMGAVTIIKYMFVK